MIEGREDLYREVDGGKLVKYYQQTLKTVETQSQQIETYPNTPYTQNNADALAAAGRALHILGEELRAWHIFLHPENG